MYRIKVAARISLITAMGAGFCLLPCNHEPDRPKVEKEPAEESSRDGARGTRRNPPWGSDSMSMPREETARGTCARSPGRERRFRAAFAAAAVKDPARAVARVERGQTPRRNPLTKFASPDKVSAGPA